MMDLTKVFLTKDDKIEIMRLIKDEKVEIMRLLKEDKTEVMRAVYMTSLFNFMAIVSAIVGLISFLLKRWEVNNLC